ncbi:MAG: FAD-binding protein [Alphaproteobacteria bacterium]|nr:FAD-binding protein [Alphaproteobacteria bacterium]
MEMPAPDRGIVERRREIARDLRRLVPADAVIDRAAELSAYESDGFTAYRQTPLITVLPASRDEVAAVLGYCQAGGIKIVPRGAGTSLSGGALPLADGITLGLARMNAITDIDLANRTVTCGPGTTNLAISELVAPDGYYYAPDPSSQVACSIGGNVAENAGGVHCLKYGLTTNNLVGLELVLMGGEVVRLGGKRFDSPGLDLMGVVTGSEGLLGVITEVTVRILKRPQRAAAFLAGFAAVEDAARCVGAVIAAGIIPAGMEMMDGPAIRAAEDFIAAGYPTEAEALLIIETDGPEAEVAAAAARIENIARAAGATSFRGSGSETERLAFWAGRKAAFPAVGRIAPDYYCMDGTIPRATLPKVLARITELSRHYGLAVANVFHAGDGNLHPLILYDANAPGELARAEDFGNDILRLCVEVGGVLTGEHGVGVEKRDLMGEVFSEDDLNHQQRLKCAFDPDGLLNPGKVFPTLHRCAELGRLHVHGGSLPHPELERF